MGGLSTAGICAPWGSRRFWRPAEGLLVPMGYHVREGCVESRLQGHVTRASWAPNTREVRE
eukprot:5177277-Pyramimonas_sp.AAC.1